MFSATMALSAWLLARGDNPHLGKVIGITSFVAAALLLGVDVQWVTSDELFEMAAVVFGFISTVWLARCETYQ